MVQIQNLQKYWFRKSCNRIKTLKTEISNYIIEVNKKEVKRKNLGYNSQVQVL